METITKNINLNVSQPNNYQLIHAMQGDNNTIEIVATIWEENKLYNIDCDNISLEWQSPSGNRKDCPIKENTDHTVTFTLTDNMLAENGDYTFCIRFDSGENDALRTFCSTMQVKQAPFGQLMESEIVTITELLQETKSYAKETKSYYEKLISEKGKPNGIATLDKSGKLPLSQLSGVNEIWSQTEPSNNAQRIDDYWLVEC